MSVKPSRFPLIADGEPVVSPGPQMRLYEDADLIHNIKGPYVDKDYSDLSRPAQVQTTSQVLAERKASREAGKTYAQTAREASKADLKRKRQAYLIQDKPLSRPLPKETREADPVLDPQQSLESLMGQEKPAKADKLVPRTKSQTDGEWSRFRENLRIEDYILAELPKVYKEPQNPSLKEGKSGNYDFLKRSQIYNPAGRQKDQQRPQEINLTAFDGE